MICLAKPLLVLFCSVFVLASSVGVAILPEGSACYPPVSDNSVVPLSTVLEREAVLVAQINQLNATLEELIRVPGKTNSSTFINCNEIKQQFVCQSTSRCVSGVYYIRPGDMTEAIPAFCDMDLDGGGWTLVMNYYSKATKNAPNNFRTDTLPLYSPRTLGFDGSTVADEWGQASPPMMNKLAFTRVRFYCKGAYKDEQIHFSTTSGMNYAKTGSGSFSPLVDRVNYPGQNLKAEFLPTTANRFYDSKGEFAMSNFPFYYYDSADIIFFTTGKHFNNVEYYFACNSHYTDGATRNFHHQTFVR